MTPRDRFIAALERKPLTGRVPHFELVFFLTMEAFGMVHPQHRHYRQWDQMEEKERQLIREDIADVYITIASRYEHGAIYLTSPPVNRMEETLRLIDIIREKTGDTYCLLTPGDATYSISNADRMAEFAYRLADEPEAVKAEAQERVDRALTRAQTLAEHGGSDGFCMCADYCFNTGPFLSPAQFGEFVTPYLAQLCGAYREMGLYAVKHTDGNIMPILDQLVEAGPHALHSLDPQAGIDIAEVKRQYGDRVCLIGNVNCGLLDTGTAQEAAASARYALENGMPGGGYIFSTSNCIYTGMALERYHIIHKIWQEEGNYPAQG